MFEFLKRLFSREGAATPKAPARARPPRPASPGPVALPGAGAALRETDRAAIRDNVRMLTRAGFDAPGEILVAAEEALDDPQTLTQGDRAWIADEVARAVAAKRVEEAGWPATTDWDRLDAVFEALNDSGLIALHRAGATLQEGQQEVVETWRGRRDARRVVGFAFYHAQDVERAAATGELWIAYGVVEGSPETPETIALRVVGAMRRAGFRVDAPPDPDTRIRVTGLDWRKRSPF
jgi:hypothetical protein